MRVGQIQSRNGWDCAQGVCMGMYALGTAVDVPATRDGDAGNQLMMMMMMMMGRKAGRCRRESGGLRRRRDLPKYSSRPRQAPPPYLQTSTATISCHAYHTVQYTCTYTPYKSNQIKSNRPHPCMYALRTVRYACSGPVTV